LSRICGPIGPLTMTTGKALPGCRLELLAARVGIEEGVHRGHQHRQVLGPSARHRERDGADLDGGDPAARRKRAEHVRARQRAAPQDPLHALARCRPQGQPVAPLVRDHQIVRPDQGVLERRPADGDHGDLPARVAGQVRRPARQPVVELALARLDRRDVAAGQEQLDRKVTMAASGRARGRRWHSS
jgi:hypothetical protein